MFVEILLCVFYFFKQKTAYEMRISDWSSDVCSSDLIVDEDPDRAEPLDRLRHGARAIGLPREIGHDADGAAASLLDRGHGLPRGFFGNIDDGDRVAALGEKPAYGFADARYAAGNGPAACYDRSEEHTSELQSLMRN